VIVGLEWVVVTVLIGTDTGTDSKVRVELVARDQVFSVTAVVTVSRVDVG
jgi:hypothetical protein